MNTAPVTICAGAKGGQGTTTIAVTLHLLVARTRPTLRIDTLGDAAAVLGIPDPAPAVTLDQALAEAGEPAPGLRLAHIAADRIDDTALDRLRGLTDDGHRVIVDTGTDHSALHRFDRLRPCRLLVTHACYLALRRAIAVPFIPDLVVLVTDSRRALTEGDVSLALALPVTSVPLDPGIARAIDAGLLATRLPRCLANALHDLTD
jgi:hypothetical protein